MNDSPVDCQGANDRGALRTETGEPKASDRSNQVFYFATRITGCIHYLTECLNIAYYRYK